MCFELKKTSPNTVLPKNGLNVISWRFCFLSTLVYSSSFSASYAVLRQYSNDVRNPAQSQPRAWAFVHRDGGFPKRCTRPAGLRTSDGFAKGKTLRKAAVPLGDIL